MVDRGANSYGLALIKVVNPHGRAPENMTQQLNGAAEKGEDEKKLN